MSKVTSNLVNYNEINYQPDFDLVNYTLINNEFHESIILPPSTPRSRVCHRLISDSPIILVK